jgi:hypothetical protein
MVLPSCAFAECLLAAVATILDRLTAIAELVSAIGMHAFGSLTRAVDLGHHEASQDHLVEGGIGTAYCCQHKHLAQIGTEYLRARNLYRRTNSLT